MFKYKILIIFIFLSWARFASAENSFLTSAYIQLSNGRFCGEVNGDDLKRAGFDCKAKNPMVMIGANSSAIFEWNVFQLGAENQIEKNKCLGEQVQALLKDETQLRTWYSQMAAAWMGIKKSELILKKCSADVFSRVELANVKRNGLKKAYEMAIKSDVFYARKPLEQEWQELCLDQDKISALKAASALFQFSLPVISNPNFFKIMENHRDMVVDKKSGKPLSDNDLLKADLQDLSFMKLKLSKLFEDDLKKSVLDLMEERNSITKKILESKSNHGFQLNSDLKDYIFEDETLYQTLASKKLLSKDYNGLGKGNRSEISAGAFCLLSKHEPNLKGELVSIAVESLVSGGIILKALRGTKYLEGLSKVGEIKKSMGYGLAVAGYTMMASQIAKSCPIPLVEDEGHRTKKVVSAIKNETLASIKASDLPEKVGYGTWNMDFDPKQTPSCKNMEQKNLMLNTLYNSNCILDSLLAIAPLKYSLPIAFSLSH